ncbi:MAG TPA: hypothetical protein VI078_03765 [bacterium]
MKRAVCALVMAAVLVLPAMAPAAPWAIVAANFNPADAAGPYYDEREGIFTVDLGTSPPHVYGPFLQGVLTDTAGSQVLDVAMLPNGRDALLSNFGDQKIYKISFSDPKNPAYGGELRMRWDTGTVDPITSEPIIYSFYAEDIAVARDGSFAIVSDGGFSPYLGFVNPTTFRLKKIQKTVSGAITINSNAVAISPDGKTVLTVDYFAGKVYSARVNATKDGLTNFRSLFLCDNVDPIDRTKCLGTMGRPVNVTISPDGMTALVALASASKDPTGVNTPVSGRVAVLRIDPATGRIFKGAPFWVAGIPARDSLTPPLPSGPGGNQSVAITPDGARAFVLTQPIGEVDDPNSDDPLVKINRINMLAQLRVTGPGRAALVSAKYKALSSRGASQLFGVETLAVDGTGRWAIVGNPTFSDATNILTGVNLMTGAKVSITLPHEAIPIGVAFTR